MVLVRSICLIQSTNYIAPHLSDYSDEELSKAKMMSERVKSKFVI